MKIFAERINWPKPGKYVVAVSGGVDSMSLLHLLASCYKDSPCSKKKYELVVAHCNHGIRPDATEDEQLVHDTAKNYGLNFQSVRLELGPKASEAESRQKRYEFLDQVKQETGAKALILAHHLDDRVETMVLNKRRGAGWLGLAPLQETEIIKRPLLAITKREIYEYARENCLDWREDTTNLDPDYTPRNRLRLELNELGCKKLYKQLKSHDKHRFERERAVHSIINQAAIYNPPEIAIDRTALLLQDVSMCRDALYLVLYTYFQQAMEIDYDAIIRLEHFYKTAEPGKLLPLSSRVQVKMKNDTMVISDTR